MADQWSDDWPVVSPWLTLYWESPQNRIQAVCSLSYTEIHFFFFSVEGHWGRPSEQCRVIKRLGTPWGPCT